MLYDASWEEFLEIIKDNLLWRKEFDVAKCVSCERPTSGSLEFCQRCYTQFKDDIKDKKPWVKALKNDAQRERRRREREYNDTSLDAILDAWTDRGKY